MVSNRGRKPTPTALRVLRGNPGRRPLPENEPTPPTPEKLPAPPSYLQGKARKEYFRLGRTLLKAGLLTELDVPMLVLYCEYWQRYREAEEQLEKYGAVLVGQNKIPFQSPYLAISNRAKAEARKILVEFGMSPSARTRVKVANGGEGKGDDNDWFFE